MNNLFVSPIFEFIPRYGSMGLHESHHVIIQLIFDHADRQARWGVCTSCSHNDHGGSVPLAIACVHIQLPRLVSDDSSCGD